MRIGVVYPTNRIGSDPGETRAFAQAVGDLKFDHIMAIDHVVGANRASRPGWEGLYDHTNRFDEPFVLLGYLAALLPDVELSTGIIILPQRQTVLAAKQAAQLDLMSRAGLRLGVGLGWNDVEYEALGQDFHTRGARIEEQVAFMRQLWENDLVTFQGRFDRITDAGFNPRPQRHIPIWFGGIDSDKALRRMARIGDGYFPIFPPGDAGLRRLDRLRSYIRDAGRDPAGFGIDAMVGVNDMIEKLDRSPEDWAEEVEWWRANGGTHISLYTANGSRRTVDDHIEAIRRFRAAVPVAA
jgi:probable F420-dependent oxidoreductase